MSGQDWPVGTVATATVNGAPDQRVMFTAQTGYPWRSVHGSWRREDVTDVRRLVVLDLRAANPGGNPEFIVENVIAALRKGTAGCHGVADQIESQVKPPRIPEPDWGVRVTASTKGGGRRQFVHAYGFEGNPDGVWTDASGFHAAWSDLIDPVLVRPGIEDES